MVDQTRNFKIVMSNIPPKHRLNNAIIPIKCGKSKIGINNKVVYHDKIEFITELRDWIKHSKTKQCNTITPEEKKKKHTIISIDTVCTYYAIQHHSC